MSEPWLCCEGHSDCCDAPVYLGVCRECGEHCGLVEDEGEQAAGTGATRGRAE